MSIMNSRIMEPTQQLNSVNKNSNFKKKKGAKLQKKRRASDTFTKMDELDWSEVKLADSMLVSDDVSGFLCLEEISDIDVEYEDTEDKGRFVRFKKVNKEKKIPSNGRKAAEPEIPLSIEETKNFYDLDTFDEDLVTEATNLEVIENMMDESKVGSRLEGPDQVGGTSTKKAVGKPKFDSVAAEPRTMKINERTTTIDKPKSKNLSPPEDVDLGKAFDVSAWERFGLCDEILNSLRRQRFAKPTAIQDKALSEALGGRDIIGAAETGSGKTLAFAIPVVQHLVKRDQLSSPQDDELTALILTPTRELAIQVKDHISLLACFTQAKIVTIVGGMSAQKQHRLLDRAPDVIVATPGRLWEVLLEKDVYAERLAAIKFLVLDEADRMLEAGHFKELDHILKLLSSKRRITNDWPDALNTAATITKPRANRQTFVFTATLDKSLHSKLKKRKKPLKAHPNLSTGTIDDLMERLDFCDPKPIVADITSDKIVAASLLEAKIDCLQAEKDVYLYYFLMRYPGRTLVFVNSIDSIRRLAPIFKLLQIEVLTLHAQMQQRQRLKSLDKFKENNKAVLIASDVAARGLDIPLVEHVVHYHLPRSSEIYVHRSGRTARANREGVSLMLCAPEEVGAYKKLCSVLNKDGYADFPVIRSIVNDLKERVNLARKIDQKEHQMQKRNHEQDWFRRAAEDMEIMLDDDLDEETRNDEQERVQSEIRLLKSQLKTMLAKRVLAEGTSGRYLTSGVMRDFAERLISDGRNKALPGQLMTKATEDIKPKPEKRQKTKK